MPQVSIARLFEDNRTKLRLEWVAGRSGADKELNSELTKDSSKGLIGHLNLIHPNLIQVVGASEAAYLRSLDPDKCRSVLAATKELACFIIAGVDETPAPLAAVAESTHTALIRSPLPSVEPKSIRWCRTNDRPFAVTTVSSVLIALASTWLSHAENTP